MPNNLPARIPARAENEVTPVSASSTRAIAPAEVGAPVPSATAPAAASPALVLDRNALTLALRFASRLASRAPIQALKSCLLADGYLVATDLDVSLRARIPSTGYLGVLVVAADALKRCVSGSEKPDVEIRHVAPTEARPSAVSVNGAILAGHDPREFPDPSHLFPDGEPRAQALLQGLEPLLAAAAIEENRKAMNAVFFQLCKNAVVTTNGHVLHAIKIDSSDRGDFLVPRKAIELVEIIRKATKTPEVAVAFHENHAVFRVATFDVSARLETAKFPAWEEIVPKKSKHELRVSKTDLLEALDRVAAAIGDRSRGVVLHRTGERLEIHGENPNAGELKTEIAASGWADKAVIEVNLGYLHNAARFAPSDELRIGLTDDASPLKIHEGPYLAVVMPIGPAKGTKS